MAFLREGLPVQASHAPGTLSGLAPRVLAETLDTDTHAAEGQGWAVEDVLDGQGTGTL